MLAHSEVHLILVPASGERCWSTPYRQAELRAVYRQLKGHGQPVRPRDIRVNSVSSLMGEFSLSLSHVVTPVLSGVMEAWVRGGAGRSVHLKVRQIDAEMSSPEDIETLLIRVRTLQARLTQCTAESNA